MPTENVIEFLPVQGHCSVLVVPDMTQYFRSAGTWLRKQDEVEMDLLAGEVVIPEN